MLFLGRNYGGKPGPLLSLERYNIITNESGFVKQKFPHFLLEIYRAARRRKKP